MATIRMKLRSSSVEQKEGTLYYQVTHKRVTRLIKTGYHLHAYEWNQKYDDIAINPQNNRKSLLSMVRDITSWEMRQLQFVVSHLQQSGIEFTCDDIVRNFNQSPRTESVFTFMNSLIHRMKTEKRARTARGFQTAMNHFESFRRGEDLSFESFDADLMKLFEAYLKAEGLVKNSTSNYMRVWRNVYNQAVEKGYKQNKSPFKHIYTGIDKTKKRAIPIKYIRKLQSINLTSEPNMDFARDLFLFSFCTRGMSYVDMAYLKRSNIRYKTLTYNRRKTGQILTIQWEKPMQTIADKYKDKAHDGYLFPIFQKKNQTETQQLDYHYNKVNRYLKKLSIRIGLNIPLSLHSARHSWASAARTENIPTPIISNGLGHTSEKITQIYLAELDSNLVDKANQKILGLLR